MSFLFSFSSLYLPLYWKRPSLSAKQFGHSHVFSGFIGEVGVRNCVKNFDTSSDCVSTSKGSVFVCIDSLFHCENVWDSQWHTGVAISQSHTTLSQVLLLIQEINIMNHSWYSFLSQFLKGTYYVFPTFSHTMLHYRVFILKIASVK